MIDAPLQQLFLLVSLVQNLKIARCELCSSSCSSLDTLRSDGKLWWIGIGSLLGGEFSLLKETCSKHEMPDFHRWNSNLVLLPTTVVITIVYSHL